MKLLIRRSDGSWTEPETSGHTSEDDLQQLLATSPDLLPGDETGLPMAVARELPVAAGRIDLVGVNVEGVLTLCECKLATNPGARREVVGQLLEYAGALRGMSFEDFSSRFEARTHSSLVKAVSEIADDGFNEESFEAQVAENLEAGRFRLVVVVDNITEALKQTVVYLNDHLDGSILALELPYLRDGQVEMLFPAVFGQESVERKPTPTGKVANADTVVVAARRAYQEYLDTNAYVCQPLRPFRDEIRYLGFYKDKAIQREFPRIQHRRMNVMFSHEEALTLCSSADPTDVQVGAVIQNSLDSGRRMERQRYQVFLLTSPKDDTGSLLLEEPILHNNHGAWTQGQRYTSSEALRRGPKTTEELAAEGG